MDGTLISRLHYADLCLRSMLVVGVLCSYQVSLPELARFLVIGLGLGVLWLRLRRRSVSEEARGSDRKPSGFGGYVQANGHATLISLVLMLVLTQLSERPTAEMREGGWRLLFLCFCTASALLSGLLVLRASDAYYRPARMTHTEGLVVCLSGCVAALAVASQLLYDSLGSVTNLSAAMVKLTACLLIWSVASRLYTPWAVTRDVEPSCIDVKARVHDAALREAGMLRWCSVICLLVGLLGCVRTGYAFQLTSVGHQHWEKGRDLEALPFLMRALEANVSLNASFIEERALRGIIQIYKRTGRREEIREVLDSTLGDVSRKDYVEIERTGDLFAYAAMWREAGEEYASAFKGARNQRTMDKLVACYLQVGSGEALSRLLRQPWLSSLRPSIERLQPLHLLVVGDAYYGMSDWKVAAEYLRLARDSGVCLGYVDYKLGMIAAIGQELSEARERFEEAVQQGGGVADVHYQLGLCYEQANQPDEALGHYETAVDLLPSHVEALIGVTRVADETRVGLAGIQGAIDSLTAPVSIGQQMGQQLLLLGMSEIPEVTQTGDSLTVTAYWTLDRRRLMWDHVAERSENWSASIVRLVYRSPDSSLAKQLVVDWDVVPLPDAIADWRDAGGVRLTRHSVGTTSSATKGVIPGRNHLEQMGLTANEAYEVEVLLAVPAEENHERRWRRAGIFGTRLLVVDH